jgi:hypothetical protein
MQSRQPSGRRFAKQEWVDVAVCHATTAQHYIRTGGHHQRDDIKTRQILRPGNSPAVLVLQLKDPAARGIKLPLVSPAATGESTPASASCGGGIYPQPLYARYRRACRAAVDRDLDHGTVARQRQLICAAFLAAILIGTLIWTLPAARETPGGVAISFLLLLSYGYGASALGVRWYRVGKCQPGGNL